MEPKQEKTPCAGRREGATKYRQNHASKPPSCLQPDFKAAMNAAGLPMEDPPIPDGRLHRVHFFGDSPGTKNGWYILFRDTLLAGAFGCWKRGISETWCAKPDRTMTTAEQALFRQRMAEVRKARQDEEERRQAVARRKASAILLNALPAPDDHPYLVKKHVRSHGLRRHNGALVIPLRDSAGTLHSLQFIDGDGKKRFLSGGRVRGCYFGIGVPAGTLCLCEGYATAASVFEATGHASAVAFNAGNLLPVARALRAKFPQVRIVICADNDVNTPGNPGLTKAREAAAAIGAALAVPPCAGDFNDLLTGGAA